jgi:hypothetical protein
MFGLLVGTLDKAKKEDKERNASEAAKKRQLIEQRLQNRLKKETDSVRRAEEAKKDKVTANRKEEDLQLKDSMYKLRRTRIPLLANFLSTADVIPNESDPLTEFPTTHLANPARSHPPPVFYLPAVLTPSQEAFLTRRKAEAKQAAEEEWAAFLTERSAGVEEITSMRQRVADEEAQQKAQSLTSPAENDDKAKSPEPAEPPSATEGAMEIDDAPPPASAEDKDAPRKVEEAVDREIKEDQMRADDEDAVEY